MTPDSLRTHVVSALQSPLMAGTAPFPFFYAENVFPPTIYEDILAHINVEPRLWHAEKFANRLFSDTVTDIPEIDFMRQNEFCMCILKLFASAFHERFPDGKTQCSYDIRLIRDSQAYKIGPHTDAPWKMISLLFYLPTDDSLRDYGTAFYAPKDRAFRCEGGPHHAFKNFDLLWRAPFTPNSCLGFWKTDHSFHGVPPIPVPCTRDVLLYNIYSKTLPEQA